jgi:PIN domain nuclease of toxin-antitoxin system
MRLLLDTHALLWWLGDEARLGPAARALIADPANDVLVSVVSLWEIVVKQRVGKLKADITAIEGAIQRDGFTRLPITPAHLAALSALPQHSRPCRSTIATRSTTCWLRRQSTRAACSSRRTDAPRAIQSRWWPASPARSADKEKVGAEPQP